MWNRRDVVLSRLTEKNKNSRGWVTEYTGQRGNQCSASLELYNVLSRISLLFEIVYSNREIRPYYYHITLWFDMGISTSIKETKLFFKNKLSLNPLTLKDFIYILNFILNTILEDSNKFPNTMVFIDGIYKNLFRITNAFSHFLSDFYALNYARFFRFI